MIVTGYPIGRAHVWVFLGKKRCSYRMNMIFYKSTHCPLLSHYPPSNHAVIVIMLFTRFDYPLAMINSSIAKTIQSFSFLERKTRKTAALCKWVCPSKIKHQLTQLKGKCVISVTRLALHYNPCLSAENWNKTSSPEESMQASNRKSTRLCLLFYLWSVWFRLCQLYSSTPLPTFCWT